MILSGIFSFFYEAQPAQPGRGNLIMGLIPFILVIVIFYMLVILPSRKRQKKHQYMVDLLKPGDRIITSGGIYGTVMGTQKDKIELKISSNVKIDLAKSAVAVILTPEQARPETH
jgi:preprotein translocase subunit YajC